MISKVIELDNITVSYLQNRYGFDSIKDLFLKSSFKNPFNRYIVLKDFDLTIEKGETLGVLGFNGCGKSTLLRTIAGIVIPDNGTVKVNCPITPLLSLGAGIEMEYTGYENIELALTLSQNYNRNAKKELVEKVVDFSELSHKDLKKPAKMYSTGMLARLSISPVLIINPQLLMIDEILSVGDIGFRNKCKNRLNEMVTNGITLIYVSHIPEEILELCNRGICIKDKHLIFDGDIEEAIKIYRNLF